MSWSVYVKGRAKLVNGKAREEFAKQDTGDTGENRIKDGVAAAVAAAFETQDPESFVNIEAHGSMSTIHQKEGPPIIKHSAYLKFETLDGFIV